MPPNNLLKAAAAVFAAILAVVIGKMVSGGDMFYVMGVILALAAAGITFLNPENGLVLLVFSMLLSPEIELAKIPGRSITVRVDDFLLIAVFIAYLTYHAVNPRARRFARTPIDRPLIAMVVIYFVSTALGIVQERLGALTSIFFALKYVQYFILFWLTANIVSGRETLRKVVIAGTVTAVAVCLYAYSIFPVAERVYAPFDYEAIGRTGESASLGGYLIIVMCAALAFFLNHDKPRVRYFSLLFFFFALPPFVRTLSRASYYALAASVFSLLFFSPKRKMTLLLGATAFLIFAPLVAPGLSQSALKRLNETFTGPKSELGIDLELSAAARVERWRTAFTEWLPQRPLLGHGATGVGLVDAQYPRIAGEFGLFGLAAFLWLIMSVFKHSASALRGGGEDPAVVSLAAGFMAALVGLLVQGFGVNTFIIVRIMTPFWFLCALVMAALSFSAPPPVRERRV